MSEPKKQNSILYFDSPLFKFIEPKISYGFLTRIGRLSDGTLIDFDLSQRPSNKTNALLLYEIFANSFELFYKKHIFLGQPHGNNIAIIKDPPTSSYLAGYDGVFTTNRDIVLNILTADCACLLITNKQSNFIGAIHCGWKSLFGNIIPKSIEKISLMKIKLNDILISIGPSIQKCCYEVKEEIRYKMKSILGQDADKYFEENGDKLYFNLPGAIREHLMQCGISSKNINLSMKCTYCEKDLFFSYRRDKNHKRLLNFISFSNDLKKNI